MRAVAVYINGAVLLTVGEAPPFVKGEATPEIARKPILCIQAPIGNDVFGDRTQVQVQHSIGPGILLFVLGIRFEDELDELHILEREVREPLGQRPRHTAPHIFGVADELVHGPRKVVGPSA